MYFRIEHRVDVEPLNSVNPVNQMSKEKAMEILLFWIHFSIC